MEKAIASIAVLVGMVAIAGCGSDVTGGACTPKTCAALGAGVCGAQPDGCGGTVMCSCTAPETCGGGGTEGVCGCKPRTCKDAGVECGEVDDGCGAKIVCGPCAQGLTCGVLAPGRCGCKPKTCTELGAGVCGARPDGCGGTVMCSCTAPETCGGGGTEGVCGCKPRTCKDAGADCGEVDDGCGAKIACGACTQGLTCGALAPNRCGCKPKTCTEQGSNCGEVEDGCGGMMACGTCPAGQICRGGAQKTCTACTPKTCMNVGTCGSFDDGCGQPLACPCPFLEDFLDTSRVDANATTGLIDTNAPGHARSHVPLPILGAGTGRDGRLAPAPGSTLKAGSFEYSEVVLAGTNGSAAFDVFGDLTLRVTGAFRATGNAVLTVRGDLTIVAGGPVVIDCSFLYATGKITVHQPSTDGVDIGCEDPDIGEADLAAWQPTRPTGIQIWTRGAVRLGRDSYLIAKHFNNVGGDIEIRAYGDVIANHDVYVIPGQDVPQNGSLFVWTEGAIRLLDASYFTTGHGTGATSGGAITLRAMGPIELRGESYLISNGPGDIDLISESDITLADESYAILQRNPPTPPKMVIRGRSFTAQNGSYLISNAGPKGGGSITVETTGDVTLTGGAAGGSNMYPARGGCDLPGANVTLRAGGKVTIDDQSEVVGGEGGCTEGPARGGDATVLAVGAIQLAGNPMERVYGGEGTPPGVRTVTPNAMLTIPPLDAGVRRRVVVQSAEQTVLGLSPATVVASVESAPMLAAEAGEVLLSPAAGKPFVPLASTVGQTFGVGFRYRVTLVGRMFDAAALDRIRVIPR